MPLRHFTRLLVAAALAAAGAPALAQTLTADIGVTLTLDGDLDTTTTPPKPTTAAGFTVGSEKTYTATVKNNGDLIVTEFTMTAAIDAAASTSYNVSGCDPVTKGVAFPCKWTGTLAPGEKTEITIGATIPAPDPLSPATATCPNPATPVTSSVTVSNPMQDATALPDSDAANNTSSVTSHVRAWADLSVESFDGPANVGENGSYTYTAVVKNLGPCTAPAVRLSFGPDGSIAYVDGSATGCSNPATSVKGTGYLTEGVGYRGRCELGDLAKGASKTVTAGYSVITFPKDQIQGAVSNSVSVASVAHSPNPASDDPNSDNDSGSSTAPVDLSSNKGCSTGGAGGLLSGLLALAGVRFARRRKA